MPTKRARGDTFAIDLAVAESAKKYEVLSPSKPSLRLFGEGDAAVEIGYVNPKSDVVFAKFDGKLYLGHNYWNPASYDATGECIEESAVGVTLMNLLLYYAISPCLWGCSTSCGPRVVFHFFAPERQGVCSYSWGFRRVECHTAQSGRVGQGRDRVRLWDLCGDG